MTVRARALNDFERPVVPHNATLEKYVSVARVFAQDWVKGIEPEREHGPSREHFQEALTAFENVLAQLSPGSAGQALKPNLSTDTLAALYEVALFAKGHMAINGLEAFIQLFRNPGSPVPELIHEDAECRKVRDLIRNLGEETRPYARFARNL